MPIKKFKLLMIGLILFFLFDTRCLADDEAKILQAYASDQGIDAFIKGQIDTENITCSMAKSKLKVLDKAPLSEHKVEVRTTILIDTSASMPKETSKKVKDFVSKLIEYIGENEKYRIVQFEDGIRNNFAFTSDRYLLLEATKLKFDGKKSRIYDTIFETSPKLETSSGKPCYYRTIVITDCMDDTESGRTKEELDDKIKNNKYPIEVVAVSKERQKEEFKELAALTRKSGGRYINLHSESNVKDIVASFKLKDFYWIRVLVPDEFADGEEHSLNISIGEQRGVLETEVKIPVFNISEEEEKGEEKPLPKQETEQEVKPVVSQPVIVKAENTEHKLYEKVIVILAAVIVLGALIAVIMFLILKIKKKNEEENEFRIIDESQMSKMSPLTTPNIGNNFNEMENVFNLRLRDVVNPDNIWNVYLDNEILIGRNVDCQICINSKNVSRFQCKIYLENGILKIENLSNVNITLLNETPLIRPDFFKVGDRVRMGNVTLMLDYFYDSHSNDSFHDDNKTLVLNV